MRDFRDLCANAPRSFDPSWIYAIAIGVPSRVAISFRAAFVNGIDLFLVHSARALRNAQVISRAGSLAA